ncbi:hypothetical protein [Planotetraspora kaengkrachanensis]|uniref:TPM domain-containing protein n=1 Tax=Planotetraspora kaengkrachanensis TaxID=575193 RepID=A0A8J3V9S4_9ACTN|nr:hypothetical protein [Planotetraspora kaengkrachanensis]GIG82304.1 hypothetical protein Pka01_54310 [Planotetraspora kaengkrachanensis]
MTINHPLSRVGATLAALAVGLLALFAFSPAALAAAPPDPATVLAGWRGGDPLFVQSGSPLSGGQQGDIRKALEESKSKIYAVAMPDGTVTTAQAGQFITTLGTELDKAGRSSATVIVLDGTSVFAGSSALPRGVTAGQLARLSTGNNPGELVTGIQDFVNRVNKAVEGDVNGARESGSAAGGGGGTGILVGILGIAVVGGAGLWVVSRRMKRKREEREAAGLAAVKQTVEEDVTKFGEEITALDVDVKMLPQAETSGDWQRALDSYERSKTELAAVKRPDDLRAVTSSLEDGRYALACVKARVNNQPLPERLPPCFFNPQHGPSVRNVRWAPPGGAVREVPACAADAEAVERGFDPQMREVVVNGQRRPYWDAGPAYQPYAYGYYGGFGGDLMTGMLVGTMLGGAFGGWGGGYGYGGGYEAGYQDGVDAGGGDFGGGGDWGGGGGDWGGGDFGGGDFGGGDW